MDLSTARQKKRGYIHWVSSIYKDNPIEDGVELLQGIYGGISASKSHR
jgi:hypothetical protein